MAISQNPQKYTQVFTQIFSQLTDPRRSIKGNFNYPFDEILFLCISAVISGMDGWTDIHNFGDIKLEWLRKYFPYKNGIPSHDTLGDLFAVINPEKFSKCFTKWVNQIAEISQGEVVAIDGKTIRKSNDKNKDKKALHVVSAYAANNQICLGQECVGEKSNEITAIPKLLDYLTLKDCVVTIDAMGCQTKIAKKIIEKEADYVLMVKGNQKNLKEDIERSFQGIIAVKSAIHNDMGHGRIETRHCQVSENLSYLRTKHDWKGLKSIIKISSETTDKHTGKTSKEERFYISSLSADAERLNEVIRKHWSVENNLHWVLDVVFKEDQSLKKNGVSALNYNIMTKIALTLIDKDKSNKKSKIAKRKSAALDDKYRAKILGV